MFEDVLLSVQLPARDWKIARKGNPINDVKTELSVLTVPNIILS